MSATIFARFCRTARTFWADTDGIILPYVTVLLVVLVGTSVLALDGARYMSLQSQLQKGADALAIAGAAELDRLSSSTQRATSAINSLVTNSSVFGTGGASNVTVSSIRFLSSLPASDNIAITSVLCTNACTSAQSIQARFVEVTVQPTTIPTIMPISFVITGGLNSVTAGASAVAGNDAVSCGLTPMFICNPFELAGDTYDQATARLETASTDATFKRKLIRLADHGPSGTWGPGDFGYLVPEPGTLPTDACFNASGDEIGKAMAMDRPLICVRQNGVDLLTGNTASAKRGLNTRFGLYEASFSAACRVTYPPDLNVRMGMRPQGGGGWCTATTIGSDSGGGAVWPPGTIKSALGADSCLIGNNSCSPYPNIGDSTWDCASYWTVNHAALNPSHAAPSGCTATATISRYEVYQQEIALGYLGDRTNSTPVADREMGTPQCLGPTPTANRRVIKVAIVNCGSSPVTIQSNAQNVPVAGFGQFFLTHPTTNQTKPYAEFLGLIERGDGSIYDQVQLFR